MQIVRGCRKQLVCVTAPPSGCARVPRWVNDGSAVAVFANPREAQAALDAGRNGHYKLRPFSEVRPFDCCLP